jgi:3-methyladenine DNA glycosylase AlkD
LQSTSIYTRYILKEMLTNEQIRQLDLLEEAYIRVADPEKAGPMASYMKNHFSFLGIPKPIRKQTERPFTTALRLLKTSPADLLLFCWKKAEREWQYYGVEYANQEAYKQSTDWPEVMEYVISHKSWWDTVDLLATHGLGDYLLKNQEQIEGVISKWRQADNLWLNRSCLLFQLHYKEHTDTNLLASLCTQYATRKEFFIQKAIGWSLRHYSRTNPEWVKHFVANQSLAPLSHREALRLIS